MHPFREYMKGSSRRRLWVALLMAVVLMGILTALLVRYAVAQAVVAVQPASYSLRAPIKGAGELTALEQADVASKSALKVQAVLVDVGQSVKRGQPLLLLDADELSAQVRVSEAAVQAARLSVDAARMAHARAVVLQERTVADAQRATALARQGPDAISATEVDTHVAAARSSRIDAEAGAVQVTSAQQAHAQALANLDVARARWRDTTLRAPFDGLVTSRHCSAGDTAAPGVPCLTVVDPASLRVRARFDESALAAIQVGDVASLLLKSQPHGTIQALVERPNRSVDIDTREFTVDFQLEEIPAGWALGERATVVVQGRERAVPLAIPLSYVVSDGTRRGVWVAKEGRAHWTALRLGARDERLVEVLDGLTSDALVLQPQGMARALPVLPQVLPAVKGVGK
ncbi:efflux RND transporter periplasmic adaptor subunit [Methyloversatilis sp. XJ19-49]|uniref:efflux RND transporter periplasmic adaptor subunit n=1 Tax=Methyloversatilis sp. XJ19-49 TaxID=2963429 RepID=UPI00211C31EE|nr:efflux RND transporter periplasmic adaptor subunit [Methyloversatilis sp. XJ19-49]MCQ9380173.1 efflux RND transporter periplasmic adaptor subunit [Methyloversatilis sp. XJ19-49]